jgi:hypothetical protein
MATHRITADTVVARSEDVVTAEVGDEIVLLNVAKGSYYDFDPVGSEVWRALTTPSSVADLCRELTTRYNVDPATCESDVIAFLQEAMQEGIFRTVS